jgi:metallo-beta-lactamase class B
MHRLVPIVAFALLAQASGAQSLAPVAPSDSVRCPSCREWNSPTPPVRIFGNVYFVGTRGLSSILLTSSEGHILVDAGLPESAPLIAANIQRLGFRLVDLKVIVNSHAHYDHAGGIGQLQSASGAEVAVMTDALPFIRTGGSTPDDPQFGMGIPFPRAKSPRIIEEGRPVTVGDIVITAHATSGHLPGGTSWSWRSCEAASCLDFVYGDSQTPVSNDEYKFSLHPERLAAFDKGFRFLEGASCDVLLTPHPGASSMFERMANGKAGLVDRQACRAYAARGRKALTDRIVREKAGRRR